MNPLGRALQVASTAPQLGETVLHGGDLARQGAGFPAHLSRGSICRRGSTPTPIRCRRSKPRHGPSSRKAMTCRSSWPSRRVATGLGPRRCSAAAAGTQALIEAIPRRRSDVAGCHTRADLRRASRRLGARRARGARGGQPRLPRRRARCRRSSIPTIRPDASRPCASLSGSPQALERRRGLLVVDEAFADVMGAEFSLVPHLPAGGDRPALVRQGIRSCGRAARLCRCTSRDWLSACATCLVRGPCPVRQSRSASPRSLTRSWLARP